MRVISGKYKGLKLDGFNINGTRPTMDRIKESLFASLQLYLKDCNVLDLFAGSGSLGIEALSNGSKHCIFVDHNPEVIKILKKNTANIDGVEILKKDYQEALKTFKEQKLKFDLIILDPPYNLNLINPCLELIDAYDLLNINGLIICEYEKEDVKTDKFVVFKSKKFAFKRIIVYKRVK